MKLIAPLTAKAIKAAGAPKRAGANGSKLFDGRGLYLRIRPNGTKGWRIRYRINGIERSLSLGIYPDVSRFLWSRR